MIFTKELAQKSGLDVYEEELYAVGNMIREIQLEDELEEKDNIIDEKDKKLEAKDKLIKQLKAQIKRK